MNDLQKRISRLNGQLRGIQKMVDDQRHPTEILQQIAAIKKAINGLTREIVTMHLSEQLPQKKKNELEEIIKRVIDL